MKVQYIKGTVFDKENIIKEVEESEKIILPKINEYVRIDGLFYSVDSILHNFDCNCIQVYLRR